MNAPRPPYQVLAPASVAFWFVLALFAERQQNLPMRDIALQRADEIAQERRISQRKGHTGLPNWGTYDGENATHEFVVDKLGRRWQRPLDSYHPWFVVVEGDHVAHSNS